MWTYWLMFAWTAIMKQLSTCRLTCLFQLWPPFCSIIRSKHSTKDSKKPTQARSSDSLIQTFTSLSFESATMLTSTTLSSRPLTESERLSSGTNTTKGLKSLKSRILLVPRESMRERSKSRRKLIWTIFYFTLKSSCRLATRILIIYSCFILCLISSRKLLFWASGTASMNLETLFLSWSKTSSR